jgi:predicted metal-dependent enzyme (double-stranded beta helix superfamily)
MTITPAIPAPAPARPVRGRVVATPSTGAHSPSAVLDRLLAQRVELLERVRFDDQQRWHLRLTPREAGTDQVEVWLLSWLPGQISALHDHGGSSGAFTVLRGALDEGVVSGTTGASTDHLWTRGPIRAFGPHHIHEVGNDGDVPAVSLHAYEPELASMTRYRLTARGYVASSLEVAGSDW